MCGIAGVAALDEKSHGAAHTRAAAAAMAQTMCHRGPDASGVWDNPRGAVALAHRRLSIIDLSPLGHNPMLWDGGRLAVTFNGEIYNFRELRQELEAAGHRFRSKTDTEVLLAAYDTWGLDSVQRLVGMFAFALWDETRQRLWVVRDRLGKKPVYYAARRGVLSFASELKAFLSDPDFPREIDPVALRLYLRYGYVPAPHSIFKAARKLEPAHYLLCESHQVSIVRYWDLKPFAQPRRSCSDGEVEAELEEVLGTAVRQRRIADVPLGAFLSGGIDSSLIVALMQEQSADPVRTFTIRFDNPKFNEANYAAAVARHLGTDHHEHPCDERQMLDVVDRLPEIFDEPFADSSAIPTFLVSKAAREQVTVALSGDGGDELFFGYPRYQYHADASWLFAMPAGVQHVAAHMARHLPTRRLRRIADVLGDTSDDPYARFIAWTPSADIRRITGGPEAEAPLYAEMRARLRDLPRDVQPGLLDLVSYLPDDILTKVDRTSMAVSLEVRAPLLDHRVVEFALGLPQRYKRRDAVSKWLLRRMLYKRVPRPLIERPKMGFGVPLDDWFAGPLHARMESYCAGDDLEAIGLDPRAFREMWQTFKNGGRPRPDLLWQAFVLVAWTRRFVTGTTAH